MSAGLEKLVDQMIDLQGNPMVSFLSKQVVDRIQKERLQAARDALLRKMRHGKPHAFRDDEVMALTFDFLRAAEEGVARQNLDWMAELIANGLAQSVLTEEEVRHLMRTVADLTADEMCALAALLRAQRTFVVSPEHTLPKATWVGCQIYRLACEELGGRIDDEHEPDAATAAIEATFASLQRTGFVVPISTWGSTMYGGTLRLARMASLIDGSATPV